MSCHERVMLSEYLQNTYWIVHEYIYFFEIIRVIHIIIVDPIKNIPTFVESDEIIFEVVRQNANSSCENLN